MTSHEQRINALMRFHGLSKAEAEKRAKIIESEKYFDNLDAINFLKKHPEYRTLAQAKKVLKINPVTKRKTSARTQSAAESYVRRPSQITKKKPTKRLIVRRTKNLQVPSGVFPNPVKQSLTARPRKTKAALSDKSFHVQESFNEGGPWKTVGIFPSKKYAFEYAKALDLKYRKEKDYLAPWIRVTA